MESQNCSQTGPGQYGSDRDTFLRVWQRVMPEERPDCPIQVEPAQAGGGALGEEAPARSPVPQPLAAGEGSSCSVPAVRPAPHQPGDRGSLVALEPRAVSGDFSQWEDVPCLGRGAMDQRERLEELLEGECQLWRRCRGLERRSAGVSQRGLAALTEGCWRRMRRLSTALFLITGVRHQPQEARNAAVPRSFLGGMREQFLGAQQQGCAYRAAAESCRDRCLGELYLELAQDCMKHAQRLRELLERM